MNTHPLPPLHKHKTSHPPPLQRIHNDDERLASILVFIDYSLGDKQGKLGACPVLISLLGFDTSILRTGDQVH